MKIYISRKTTICKTNNDVSVSIVTLISIKITHLIGNLILDFLVYLLHRCFLFSNWDSIATGKSDRGRKVLIRQKD